MAIKHSTFLPTGFTNDLAGFTDPAEAFEALVGVAKTIDEAGYEAAWVPDHFVPVPASQAFLFESWSVLTALARETQRVRLGHMVTGNSYRNPALQAKMASTADVISGGRFTMGIGSGWYEPDYVGYGYDFHDAGERLRRLREAVQVIRAMWTEDEATFEGKYYQIKGAINQPKGLQSPHIPMMVAGGGEKVTLKIVAEFADACNVIESPEGLKRKFGILKEHCETVGRDYDAITKTTSTLCIIADTDEEAVAATPPFMGAIYPGNVAEYGLVGTVETIHQRIAAYEEAGVQELAVSFLNPFDHDLLRSYASEFIK
ncbi:LLM class F420-dependent oxidoreductase [Actinosynnema sp. NPDC002837]